jgi:excinuclease UvrABC ATPase subunit
MKGVRHIELNPFLRRLAKEGLWDPRSSFERLSRAMRDLILFGFWSRPGPGSFLKNPRANPSEVASWLRWDGLYRHVLAQANRSHDAEWGRRVHESADVKRCMLCGGSGLQAFAGLLKIGDVSFADWKLMTDADQVLDSLRTVQPNTPRQRRAWQRILHCLAPLAKPRSAAVPAAIVERSVESFTTMPAVALKEVGAG